jgi:hypothetical protein
MKRAMMILAVVFVLVPASLWAQDVAPAEVFGGFSVYTVSDSGLRTTPVGWQASVAGHLTPRFSLVGDFGGQYKDGGHVYQYLGGVRITERMERASVFGHALFGASRSGGDNVISENAFTMAYGGGVDVNATDRFGIRVIQFDWLPVHTEGVWVNNSLRFGFGIVYKFGS